MYSLLVLDVILFQNKPATTVHLWKNFKPK